MESDISLIQISGEDDSLLQKFPNDDVSTISNTYFSCSPLQLLRSKPATDISLVSPIEGPMGKENAGRPSYSMNRNNSIKDNITGTNSEVPKLSVERQRMKRKKKGGYNLRKSIAWDRAFSTEKGVLDPLELSMISGSAMTSGGGILSAICEEGEEFLSGDLDFSNDVTGLGALEKNLFKELPARTLNGDRQSSASLSLKHDSSPSNKVTPLAKGKVLAAHDVNRSGSKRSGCPRPVAPSSLKRPANVHIATATATATAKESKVSKIHFAKPDLCFPPTTSKRSIPGASYSKHNQTAQPAGNVQRRAGLKLSSNTSNVRDTVKAGLSCRPLTAKAPQQAKRNVVRQAKKTSEIHSSMSSRHQMVMELNNASGMVQDQVSPASGHTVHGHDDESRKAAFLASQVQTEKPSGLRMPTPSLGFFNQPKNSSAAQNTLKRSSQHVSESSISNSHKPDASSSVHDLRPPQVPYNVHEMAKTMTTYGNNSISSLSTGCSVPSTLNTASHKITEHNVEKTNMQHVALNVPCDPNSCETMNNLLEFHNIRDHVDKQFPKYAEENKSEKISLSDVVKLHGSNIKFQLQSERCEKLQKESATKVGDISWQRKDENGDKLRLDPDDVKGLSHTNDRIGHQHVEIQCILSQKNYDNANSYYKLGTPLVHDENKQSGEQAQLIKQRMGEVGQIPNENQRQQTDSGAFVRMTESSEEFKKYDSENIANGGLNAPGFTANKLEISNALLQSVFKREKDMADGTFNRSWDSQVDVQAQSLGDIVSVYNTNNILSFSPLHNQSSILYSGDFEEHVEVSNLHPVIDQVYQNGYGSNVNDCLLPVQSSSYEESHGENVLRTVQSIFPRQSKACGSEIEGPSSHCSILPAVKDCGDLTQMVECQHEKDAPSSAVDSNPVSENDKCFIDTQLRHAIKLDGQATPSDIESFLRMDKDLITGDIDAYNFGFSNVCPIRGDLIGTEIETPLLKFQHGPAVKAEGGSDINMIQDGNIEKRQYSPVEKFDLQDVNVEDRQYSLSNNTRLHNDRIRGEHDQANLSSCECMEAEITSNVENQSQEISHHPLSTKSTSFEESQIFDNGNIVNVSPNLERSGGNGLGSPCGWFQHKDTNKTNEKCTEVSGIIEESVEGDAQVQVLDGSPVADNCDIYVSTSIMDNQYSLADNASEKSRECLELQNSNIEVEQVSQDSHISCSFDDFLLSDNNSFEKPQEENGIMGVLKQSDDCGIKNETVNTYTQVSPAVLEVGVVDRDADILVENAKLGLDEIESAGENCKSCIDTNFAHDKNLSGPDHSLNFHSSVKMSSDQSPEAESAFHDKTFCSLNKESWLSVSVEQTTSRGSILHDVEANVLDGDILLGEAETKISQSSDSNDAVVPLNKSGIERKQDALVMKPPSHAVPFSDEWLAAFEAAGEEILTIKSGAVQHSPTEKSVPEPGPYSPVKRKNNQAIGPFDCTKFSNLNSEPSNSR